MKKELLPDFAKPYKTKGYDVRLVSNRYQLFKISSVREPGRKYPRLVQDYVGTIDPEKGFIPKKAALESAPLDLVEFGLSSFILKHFKRHLMRSVFNGTSNEVYLGVLYYLYGHVEERFLKLTYLQKYLPELPQISGDNALLRIKSMAAKISDHMEQMIPDKADRDYLEARLRGLRAAAADSLPKIEYPSDVKEIFNKYKVKYE